jgi:hypothetical protein
MNNAPSSRYVIISVVNRASPGQNQNQYWIERDGVVLKACFSCLDETVSYIEADQRRKRVIGFRALPFIRTLLVTLGLALWPYSPAPARIWATPTPKAAATMAARARPTTRSGTRPTPSVDITGPKKR